MKQGRLENGFEFTIDEEVMDDMELVDAMAEAEESDPLKFSTVVLKVLGKEQRNRLYDYLRDENGKVPIMAVANAITEILKSAGEDGKNY